MEYVGIAFGATALGFAIGLLRRVAALELKVAELESR
jgi:hypothetical protein